MLPLRIPAGIILAALENSRGSLFAEPGPEGGSPVSSSLPSTRGFQSRIEVLSSAYA
jgi:hypothetical protein